MRGTLAHLKSTTHKTKQPIKSHTDQRTLLSMMPASLHDARHLNMTLLPTRRMTKVLLVNDCVLMMIDVLQAHMLHRHYHKSGPALCWVCRLLGCIHCSCLSVCWKWNQNNSCHIRCAFIHHALLRITPLMPQSPILLCEGILL